MVKNVGAKLSDKVFKPDEANMVLALRTAAAACHVPLRKRVSPTYDIPQYIVMWTPCLICMDLRNLFIQVMSSSHSPVQA